MGNPAAVHNRRMHAAAIGLSFRAACNHRAQADPGTGTGVDSGTEVVNITEPAMSDTVQLLNAALIQHILNAAQESDRGRMNHNFHANAASNPHRFLNVMCRGTYVTPHRHLEPPKRESFLILHGEVLFLLFDDDGRVTESHVLRGVDRGVGPFGIDIVAGLWHSLAVLSEHAVCYEVKAGPWDPATDKEFAPWAPSEGDAACSDYLAQLLAGQDSTIAPNPGPT